MQFLKAALFGAVLFAAGASVAASGDDVPADGTVPPPYFNDARGGAFGAASDFVGNLAFDLKTQAGYPFRLAQERPFHFLVGALGLGAMIATDTHTRDMMASTSVKESIQHEAQAFSSIANGRNTAVFVLGIGAIGIIGGSSREKQTSLMMTEAVLTSALWTDVLKRATGRERPREMEGSVSDWTGPGELFDDSDDSVGRGLRSFPSGHSSGTWALATVLAHQYPEHGVVPVIAYGSAAAMSYSRIVVGAHWFSDVVMGGLLGYGCARQVIAAHKKTAPGDDDPDADEWHFGLQSGSDYTGVTVSRRF